MAVLDQILKEFPQVDENTWKSLFLKETKKDEFNFNHSVFGFDYKPFYTSGNSSKEQQKLMEQLFPERKYGWNIQRVIAVTDIALANTKAHEALQSGVSSLVFKGDINDYEALCKLLKGIEIAFIEVCFDSSRPNQLADLYVRYCKENDLLTKVNGAIYFDPIMNAALAGGWNESLEKTKQEWISFQEKLEVLPGIKSISVNGAGFHYSGLTMAQSAAYSLSVLVEYMNWLTQSGKKPEQFLAKIAVQCPVGLQFFAEIALLRALRLVWFNIGSVISHSNKTIPLTIHASTSYALWSVADKNNNMLRATTQVFAAVAGGADAVIALPYTILFNDEQNDFAQRIASNIQLLLREESFLSNVIDPASGSGLVEDLTTQFAAKIIATIKEIEKAGGILYALSSNAVQQEAEQNFTTLEKAVLDGKIKVLGANLYPDKNEKWSELTIADLHHVSSVKSDFRPLKQGRLALKLESQMATTQV